MQIVIEISDTLKKIVDENDSKAFFHFMWQAYLMDAIKNGVPLPEGHGRLIDADDLLKHYDAHSYFNGIEERKIHFVQIGYVHDAPTIIEPYKEGD